MKICVYGIFHDEDEKYIDGWMESVSTADMVVVGHINQKGEIHSKLHAYQSLTNAVYITSLSICPFRFDTARNATLALVSPQMDVCISLDMDERLAEDWRVRLEKVWRPLDNNGYCSLKHTETHTFETSNRIHSRHGWVWRFPCHEALYEHGIRKRTVTIDPITDPFIYHYRDLGKDRSQYLDLLCRGVMENPTDRRMLHYYGREFYYQQRYMEAIPWLEMYSRVNGYPNVEEETENARILNECLKNCNIATRPPRS